MSEVNLPDDLRKFIQANVPTVGALEVLLLLQRDPDKLWSIADLTRELRSTALAVADILSAFQLRGLTAEKPGAMFQFAPATPEAAASVKALAEAYAVRPVTVVTAIYAREESSVRSFADAFKIKKD